MNSNESSSPIQNRNILSVSFTTETNPQQQKREGLTTKIRQTINEASKRIQAPRNRKISLPDLKTLTPQSQELLFHTVETIKNEDSKNIMITLDESRRMLKNTLEDFTREQNEYKKQLEGIRRDKEAAIQRRKENAIPLSIFMKQKRDIEGLADLRPNSGMNTTYQAYFEALLSSDQNQQQHPTDKAAVIKYIRRRERRKRAEKNRQNRELTNDMLKKQTAELIEELDGMDVKFEHERQRQHDLLRTKMNEKKNKTQNMIAAHDIIDQANEANLTRQRVEQTHREKIEARLSAVRHQQNQISSNLIYVQSHSNNENENSQLNGEQLSITKNSIQLLNQNDNYKSIRSTTPIYSDKNYDEKISNINI